MPLGMKSHISIQLGRSLSLTSMSLFSFNGTTDAILESLFSFFKRALIPSWGIPPLTPLKLNYLLKALPPITITLRIWDLTYEFVEDTHHNTYTLIPTPFTI